MFKTRIASTTALFTFGLAAIGGTALAVAAPGYAAPDSTSSSGSSSTSSSDGKHSTPGSTPSHGKHSTPGTARLGATALFGPDGPVEPQNEIFLEDWYDKYQPIEPTP